MDSLHFLQFRDGLVVLAVSHRLDPLVDVAVVHHEECSVLVHFFYILDLVKFTFDFILSRTYKY